MKLYVVGIGPGDPELITLKAKKTLESVNTIFCPKGGKDSIALSIVEKTIDLSEKKIITLQFPMLKTKQQNLVKVWNELAENIIEQATEDSAFITLGDPSFYCTFFYLYEYLKDKIQIELIPGVSSINASSCRLPASLALGDERIAIVPANYHREIDFYIENFDTIVLMKPHKTLDRIKKALKTKNCRVFYIKKATMPEEAIFSGLDEIKESDLDYFSMVVIKK
ncbi:MAG TPA: precorrin-2 C(20)-methyltransferase [Thermodesulfovibrio thiophilus]|mgnify:CR=1 FL=1|nr:precorrin-2 C(20)-methyltransferase [Thermodesulfovibrio thiophilus]HQA04383.1 precorrin-2 C(20)-methyltransferase [Thermodesulfovibrio thiophilus]